MIKQLFKKYIEIEVQLGNMDRCRKLYEKYLEWAPENCYAWIKYAELEQSLSETERTRAIYELAIAQPALDMPELLWKVTNMYAIVCVLVSCNICQNSLACLVSVIFFLLFLGALSFMLVDSKARMGNYLWHRFFVCTCMLVAPSLSSKCWHHG